MNTPKEIAIELVDKFSKHSADMYHKFSNNKHAKKCAIIHCEGVLKAYKLVSNFKHIANVLTTTIKPTVDNNFLIGEQSEFTYITPIQLYEQVIQEINKL